MEPHTGGGGVNWGDFCMRRGSVWGLRPGH